MDIFVFLGPTLSHTEAKSILDAHYLEPARTGDVYRVAKRKPQVIIIIDGYFDRVPTVWHKEILYAMEQGIHVFGTSSMGALRAAELQAFGMIGKGKIFEDFISGRLEDDDEVAVAHARADDDFQALSVAMVDIRATLQNALTEKVIIQEHHDAMIQFAKSLFYPQRHYQAILQYYEAQPFLGQAQFEKWLAENRVEQKRLDAMDTLKQVKQMLSALSESKTVDYALANTTLWTQMLDNVGDLTLTEKKHQHLPDVHVLDELRLNQKEYHRLMRLTLLQLAAKHIIGDDISDASEVEQLKEVAQFLAQRGITPEKIQIWLANNSTTLEEMYRLVSDYTSINDLTLKWHSRITEALPGVLKLSGVYQNLARRALSKQKILEQNYLDKPDLGDVSIDTNTLYQWYFMDYLGFPFVPDDVSQYAYVSGFRNITDFKRAALREYIFKKLQNTQDS